MALPALEGLRGTVAAGGVEHVVGYQGTWIITYVGTSYLGR